MKRIDRRVGSISHEPFSELYSDLVLQHSRKRYTKNQGLGVVVSPPSFGTCDMQPSILDRDSTVTMSKEVFTYDQGSQANLFTKAISYNHI